MKSTKRFFWTLMTGGLVGAVLFAWLSPYIIVWYFSPPADIGLSCKPSVEWAIATYRKVMFTGVLLGIIVAGILFFAFARGRGPAQAVPPNSSPDL